MKTRSNQYNSPKRRARGEKRQKNLPSKKPSDDAPSSPSKAPVRKKRKEQTRCVCGKPACDTLMKKLEALNDSSITYFNVPALPKPILPKARKPERIRKKDMIHRHNSHLACLGAEAKRRVELFKQGGPDRYSDKSYPQFASIHLHPEILKEHLKDGHLPKEIPGEVGVKLSQEGSCIFKEKDEVPSSEERNFVALPNYPLARAQEF